MRVNILAVVVLGSAISGCAMDDMFYDPAPSMITTETTVVTPVAPPEDFKAKPKKASGPKADHPMPSAVEMKSSEAPPIAPPVSNL